MVRNSAAQRPPPKDRPKNQLLRALPEQDFQRLLPDLKTIPTRAKQSFYKHNGPIDYVYFPNGGVASITAITVTFPAVLNKPCLPDELASVLQRFLPAVAGGGDRQMHPQNVRGEELR